MKATLTEMRLDSNDVWVREKTVVRQTNNENIRCVIDTLIVPLFVEYGYTESQIYNAMSDIAEENTESF